MTNPIAKAIAKVAVNMGYGKASDYKGCTISEVLYKFASLAKSGGSGNILTVVCTPIDASKMRIRANKTAAELKQAVDDGKVIMFSIDVYEDFDVKYICDAMIDSLGSSEAPEPGIEFYFRDTSLHVLTAKDYNDYPVADFG